MAARCQWQHITWRLSIHENHIRKQLHHSATKCRNILACQPLVYWHARVYAQLQGKGAGLLEGKGSWPPSRIWWKTTRLKGQQPPVKSGHEEIYILRHSQGASHRKVVSLPCALQSCHLSQECARAFACVQWRQGLDGLCKDQPCQLEAVYAERCGRDDPWAKRAQSSFPAMQDGIAQWVLIHQGADVRRGARQDVRMDKRQDRHKQMNL